MQIQKHRARLAQPAQYRSGLIYKTVVDYKLWLDLDLCAVSKMPTWAGGAVYLLSVNTFFEPQLPR